MEKKNLLIRASAGTGKTFQLSNRFIRLLGRGVPVEEILATTFTRKAAGEILNRVMLRLAEAYHDAEKLDELDRHAGPIDRAGVLSLLVSLTRQLHRLRILTLDSFFAQLARTQALELGLSPAWSILEPLEDNRLREAAVEHLLRNDAPSPAENSAEGLPSGGEVRRLMHLIHAGDAERSVSSRISEQVEALYEIFLETTERDWQCVPRESLSDDAALESALETLETADMPTRQFAKARDTNVASFRSGDWEGLISKGLAAKLMDGSNQFSRREIDDSIRALYQPLLDHARAVLLNTLANQTEATWQLLARFDEEYSRLKGEQRGLRFSDVTRELAGTDRLERTEAVAFRLDASLKHLLLDEFQDTSLDQWRVVRPFASRVAEDTQGSLFCVGDAKQAIYGWRGGVAEIFEAVNREIPGLDTDHLERSFRSSPAVIEAVNQVFQAETLDKHGNLGSAEKPCREWLAAFPEHTTARENLSGYVALETAAAAKEGEKQAQITLDYAAERIERIHNEAPGYTIGVLVRKNDAVRRLIYQLQKRGVDASEEGGSTLVDSAAVQCVLSLLRLADHPGDTASAFHVAHSPLAEAAGLSDFQDPAERRRVAARYRRRLLEEGYGPVIGGLAEHLLRYANAREALRLRQLTDLAWLYESRATLRCDDFVRWAESERVAESSESPVRVMTVHQSKGLQFDIVVLAELDAALSGQRPACAVGRPSPTEPIDRVCLWRNATIRQVLPPEVRSAFEETESRRVKESLCLLYVMITRAIHALHMIIPPTKPSAKSESMPKTFAGLLRGALVGAGRVEPETTLIEIGEPDWQRREARKKTAAPAPVAEPLRVELAASPRSPRRGRPASSPSKLAGRARPRAAQLLSTTSRAAMARGTLIHAWFEQIEWLDSPTDRPDEAVLRQVGRRLGCSEEQIEAGLAEFPKMLSVPEIRRALCRAAYDDLSRFRLTEETLAPPAAAAAELELRRETRIVAIQDDSLLTGYVDRLVVVRQGGVPVAAEVIDFKTGGTAAQQEHDPAETYRGQMAAYQRAVADMLQIAPRHVAANLLFVDTGRGAAIAS